METNCINLVCDLETVSLEVYAGIIAIALVPLAFPEPLPVFYEKCRFDNLESKGFELSMTTLDWWSKQDKAVRDEAFSGTQDIEIMLARVSQYFTGLRETTGVQKIALWGNGVLFDNLILANAFNRCDIEIPWTYHDDMDYRTFRRLFKDIVREPVFMGDKHNALADATHEAKYLEQMLQWIEDARGTLYAPLMKNVDTVSIGRTMANTSLTNALSGLNKSLEN